MTKTRRYLIIGITMTLLTLAVPSVFFSEEKEDTLQELKSSYLQSIYDDCRIFLEGIELFVRRDYPNFWKNIQNDKPIPPDEIERYTKELRHFKGQLDALFEEYITFKNSSGNTGDNAAPFSSSLEQQIYQMLAYAYIKTGDFAMSYDLLQDLRQNNNVFSKEYTLKLIDIDGRLKDFPLTSELKNLFRVVSSNLTFLTIRTRYFFPSDIQYINAYLTIPDYDKESSFNKTYFGYYKEAFTGLGQIRDNSIHFSEIINFINRRSYKNLARKAEPASKDRSSFEESYVFPVIKGSYGIDHKDRSILGSVSANNKIISLERLCVFNGFAETDFKRLKSDEMKNVKNETYVDRGLTLVPTGLLGNVENEAEDKSKDTKKRLLMDYEMGTAEKLKKGDMLRYDVYRVFDQGRYLGLVELVPCYKGEACDKRSTDKSITKVNVYNHELVFYQDILDDIQAKQKMYGKSGDLSLESSSAKKVETTEAKKPAPLVAKNDGPPEKVHVGRGCSAKR